jgi:hypothetical protein
MGIRKKEIEAAGLDTEQHGTQILPLFAGRKGE